MSSTNKTTNYELSQFIGSDKPAWLQDYNTDMSKIDAQMKANADGVTSASGTASAASVALGDITSLTTTDKSSAVAAINEVKSTADTAASTAQAAATTANSANSKADTALADFAKFDLSNTGDCTVTLTIGGTTTTITDHRMRFSKNSDGSIFKIYGYIQPGNLLGKTGNAVLKISGINLPVSSEYTINTLSTTYYVYNQNTAPEFIIDRAGVVKTDGTIEITIPNLLGDVRYVRIIVPPCLYFNTNFGD